jgi:hypothetical protein
MKYALLFLCISFSAHAVLGEKIQASASVKVLRQTRFSRFEKSQPKLTVHEFADNGGRVFAVTWQGKTHPDLSILLGSHLADFQRLLAKARQQRPGRGPISIEEDGLHIEMGGPPRAVFGRVWLSSQIPVGVDQDEIH